jgi:SP family sugar:H+ symporter-like MFS transporter
LFEAELKRLQVLVAMGGFIYGFDTGQISGFLQMEEFRRRFGQQAPDGRYYFSNVRSGLIVGLLSIGTLFGCLSAAPLSNRIGRKPVIPIGCFIFVVGVTIQIAVGEGEWYGVAIGRLVAGAGVGVLSVMVPTYMSETTPKQVRGAVISCYQLFITIGIFIADCINYGTEDRQDTGSYRITMGVGYIWAIVLGLGILLLPESPRWDFTHNFSARAKRTMAKFYGVPSEHRAIREEVEEIETAIAQIPPDHK